MSAEILDELYETIRARLASAGAESSYVASLAKKGLPKIRSKVQEEAGELLEASVRHELGEPAEAVAAEAADLLFHVLVLLGAQGVEPEAVFDVLRSRMGTSGLAEKAARGSGPKAD
jgi:phosphoribosyl-ATP pyrophosphohydrolase